MWIDTDKRVLHIVSFENIIDVLVNRDIPNILWHLLSPAQTRLQSKIYFCTYQISLVHISCFWFSNYIQTLSFVLTHLAHLIPVTETRHKELTDLHPAGLEGVVTTILTKKHYLGCCHQCWHMKLWHGIVWCCPVIGMKAVDERKAEKKHYIISTLGDSRKLIRVCRTTNGRNRTL